MEPKICTVKFFGSLRDSAGGAGFQVPVGSIGAILSSLADGKEDLRPALFDGQGLKPHVRVMLNGRDIELLDGLETAVEANDQLAIFPPMGGGGCRQQQPKPSL